MHVLIFEDGMMKGFILPGKFQQWRLMSRYQDHKQICFWHKNGTIADREII
jgi:hypothetical protein